MQSYNVGIMSEHPAELLSSILHLADQALVSGSTDMTPWRRLVLDIVARQEAWTGLDAGKMRVDVVARAIRAFATSALRRRVADAYLIGPRAPLERAFDMVFGRDLRVPLFMARYPLRRVLLVGETGSGKEGMASIIGSALDILGGAGKHVRVSAAAFAEGVLESELFGHKKGAFTGATAERTGLLGEVAEQGTLFLDELDKTTPAFQARLLRVIESHAYRPVGDNKNRTSHFHLIAATSASQRRLFSGDILRPDLLHRLSDMIIDLPPLRSMLPAEPRARRQILSGFVSRELEQMDGDIPSGLPQLADNAKRIAGAIERRTRGYGWPGNLRQLSNLVRQIAIQGTESSGGLCREMVERAAGPVAVSGEADCSLKARMLDVERTAYELESSRSSSIVEVARVLGVTRQTAARRMRFFGLAVGG